MDLVPAIYPSRPVGGLPNTAGCVRENLPQQPLVRFPPGVLRRTPGQRQHHATVRDHRRIDDDEVAESASLAYRCRLSPGKDASEVPRPVVVLPDVDDRIGQDEMTDHRAAIEQVAQVVADRGAATGDEQLAAVVANLQRIDRHSIEESAPDAANVHRAPNLRGQPG
jgi:hypothetical protein